MKAAFLYNFVNYVSWPAEAFPHSASPVVIGVAGHDEVHAELADLVRNRTAQTRPVVVRRWSPGDGFQGLHMLFVGRKASANVPVQTWLHPLRNRPVLLVSEDPRVFDQGSAINFVLVDGQVRFEASVRAVEQAGIRLSARLLAVAHRVVTP